MLRRSILQELYENYKDRPFNLTRLSDLKTLGDVDPKDIVWNAAYLENAGYIEKNRVSALNFLTLSEQKFFTELY
jgi:hypothetical protein